MRINLPWCFCRKICSNSWKVKLPCLGDIGRVLVILFLQNSVFNTAVHDIVLYYDRVSFKHSLILRACLTLGLFSSAKTAQHSPNCSHTTWFRESFVIELGQNCQTYLQRSVCTYPAAHRNNLAVISYCFPGEILRGLSPKTVQQKPCVLEAVKLMKVHFKHLSKSLFQKLSLIIPFKLPTKQTLKKSKIGKYMIQASY